MIDRPLGREYVLLEHRMTTIYKTDLFFIQYDPKSVTEPKNKEGRCSQTARETFSHELILINISITTVIWLQIEDTFSHLEVPSVFPVYS